MSIEFVREIISENRYLTLATTDGTRPWAAPLEYMVDEDLKFVFFSTGDSLHAQHIEVNPEVSVAIFGGEQPEYTPDVSTTLRGIQVKAVGSPPVGRGISRSRKRSDRRVAAADASL